ncbi:MAG: DUF3320 domain-containing protein [Planctomycetes bacterium]|nr:DUF3320 domain-containing protein [Planctomycetota bacterium]
MNDLERQLGEARRKLLDLTLRNRLLNHRPSPRRSLGIVDELASEVYQRLVLEEKAMGFRPAPEPGQAAAGDEEAPGEPPGAPGEGIGAAAAEAPAPPSPPPAEFPAEPSLPAHPEPLSGEEEAALLWALPGDEVPAVAERHRDRFLQTDVRAEALQKRLFYIHQQARTVLEEQGYTVLYLALGFLHWREPETGAVHAAPLLLIPVDLERPKVGTAFKIRWTHEEIHANISLKAKLAEIGAALPDFEMPEDKAVVDAYFGAVAHAVAELTGWRVEPGIVLDFFSFTKFVMFKDLDPAAWPPDRSPADHPLLRTLLDPSAPPADDGGFREEEVDEKLSARDVFHVMDADPSQIAVIEDVKAGRNLVVEGPPGTGKSQTITNVIAELLAAGKTVLFVSEKMAALEVVKARLDRVGLGTFCLELHSRKSRKREVLEDLKRTLAESAVTARSREGDLETLETLKAELNGYARALRQAVGATGLTPFALYGLSERAHAHFAAVGRAMPRVRLEGAEAADPARLGHTRARLEELRDALALVHPLACHPWRGGNPGAVLPADEEAVAAAVGDCERSLEDLRARAAEVAALAAMRAPESAGEVGEALAAARLLGRSVVVGRENLEDARWDGENVDAAAVLERLETFRSRRTRVLEHFRPELLEEDVGALRAELEAEAFRFFRWFSGRYRLLKRRIAAHYRDRLPRDRTRWLLDLDEAERCRRARAELAAIDARARFCFGPAWQGEASEPEALRALASWLRAFRAEVRAGRFGPATIARRLEGFDAAALERAAAALAAARDEFSRRRGALAARIGLDFEAAFGAAAEAVPLVELAARLEVWAAEIRRLQPWSRYRAAAASGLKTPARALVERLADSALEPADLLAAFEGNLADTLLGVAFAEREELARFVGEIHEKTIARFRALDLELIEANRRRLAAQLFRRRPPIAGGASPGSEAGILLGEFNRKRGHLPIRQLMSRAGGLVQRIKPCFMMSPLSIAQFLTPQTARFDVVVFDEASQVRPEDALGALLRGNRVVVMGDTRQLPPTSFFDHLLGGEEEVDEALQAGAPLADIESILHQCRRCFPVKTLRWHYRSRHESLIAVSNRAFYEDRLRIYPSPHRRTERLGLALRHLPDTRYDRGRSGMNRLEARAVAEAALAHFRTWPERSLGIGAFNIRQQQAILEEVELLLRRHPELEPRFLGSSEPFFVKNLETIQGDERDVIFLSIGFGFDAEGRLSRNFGPLNQEGGERRLNVLITRARERCEVFSNFRAEDLRVDETTPVGLRVLKTFLAFAEHGVLPGTTPGGDGGEGSPIEEAVEACLRERGLEVVPRVGCAGSHVALGVVDPAAPGSYRLGVEMDAPDYHEATVARERDRLRRQVLENLGWRLARTWSTDWYRDRTEARRRLLAAVDRILQVPPPAAAATPLAPAPTAARAADADEEPPAFEPGDPLGDVVIDYERCEQLPVEVAGEFAEQPRHVLASVVKEIVSVEGPVHQKDVVRRAGTLWGLKRAGRRVAAAVEVGIALAVARNHVRRDGVFLWPRAMAEPPVRRRRERDLLKIDRVAPAELAAAARLVLRYQFATPVEDLVHRTARLLGFVVTTPAVKERVEAVFREMLARGAIREVSPGTVDLADRA